MFILAVTGLETEESTLCSKDWRFQFSVKS